MNEKVTATLQNDNISRINFQHDSEIITNINIAKKFVKLKTIKEPVHGEFHVNEDLQADQVNASDQIYDTSINKPAKAIENWIVKTCAYGALTIGTSILIFIILKTNC